MLLVSIVGSQYTGRSYMSQQPTISSSCSWFLSFGLRERLVQMQFHWQWTRILVDPAHLSAFVQWLVCTYFVYLSVDGTTLPQQLPQLSSPSPNSLWNDYYTSQEYNYYSMHECFRRHFRYVGEVHAHVLPRTFSRAFRPQVSVQRSAVHRFVCITNLACRIVMAVRVRLFLCLLSFLLVTQARKLVKMIRTSVAFFQS